MDFLAGNERLKKIEVLVLTTSYPLDEQSVSGIFVKRLVCSFPKHVKAKVLVPASNKIKNYSNSDNIGVTCFRYAPWKWQVIAHQPGGIPVALKNNKFLLLLLPFFLVSAFLYTLVATKNSSVVHANWSINGLIAGIAGKLYRKPVITTVRGEDITRSESSLAYKFILKSCLFLNQKIVAVSESIFEILCKRYPEYLDKIEFIPNGVDNKLLGISRHDFISKSKSEFTVVTIGSLIPRKNVITIIEAIKIINLSLEVKLVIIGDGVDREKLFRAVVENGLEHKVVFLGEVAPDDIVTHLTRSDALALASYSEGRPNVVLESLAAGVPVIASNIPGTNEIIKDGINGMLFDPEKAEELADKITDLYANENLRNKFSRQGREYIVNNGLLWEKVGEKYAKLYSKFL